MRNDVIALVSNNIATDQRLIKVGTTLQKNGFDFQLIGSSHVAQPDLSHIPFKTKRINFIFNKNFPFYAELQIKMLMQLMSKKKDNTIILANDLDTLLPAKMIADLYKIPLVVDFHEIFSEMPTLKEGSYQKKTWQFFEKQLVPGLKHTYTVSRSYAEFFHNRFGIRPEVIKNLPILEEEWEGENLQTNIERERKPTSKILIYQGAMNYARGIDKMIHAIQFLDHTVLWLVGDGPYLSNYQDLVAEKDLNSKIKFWGNQKPEDLKKITPRADLGLSLEEDKGLSYRYALPNKIFDYIHAQIPVLGSSDLVEVKKLIQDHNIGDVIQNHEPEHIASKIKEILNTGKSNFQANLIHAKNELNWQKQEQKLVSIFQKAAHE